MLSVILSRGLVGRKHVHINTRICIAGLDIPQKLDIFILSEFEKLSFLVQLTINRTKCVLTIVMVKYFSSYTFHTLKQI